jgi:enoyl-CoA hydratase
MSGWGCSPPKATSSARAPTSRPSTKATPPNSRPSGAASPASPVGARTKPIIAAVDGPALAGGTEIVLSCDLVVASTIASFGIPEVKRSLVAAAGGLFRLPRLLPRNIALELGLTGDPITAERAFQFGLVNELVEPGQALAAALVLGGRIAANAPLAVRETLRLMLELPGVDDETAFRESGKAMMGLASSEDFWEGPKAFLEKREPEWKGR